MYSEKVIEHFMCPQNCGRIANPDVSYAYGDPGCGDAVIFFMKVQDNIIEDISYLIYGCSAAVASASMASVLVKGRTLADAINITEKEIEDALGGLPESKKHCSNLGAGAIKGLIKKFYAERENDQ